MIPHNRVCLREEDEVLLAGVLMSGQIGQGPQVRAFEAELAERFRPDGDAVCVSSGTAALRLAMFALGYEDVVLPTYACISLYHAINDGTSVIGIIDCEPHTLNSPTATVAVHTYGLPCEVMPSAIEDFTHAPGAPGCGARGAASVISFGATKPLGLGGGGAVLGPSDMIDEIRDLRDYDGKRDLKPRFNWQMSDILAALGRHRLERLDDENARRREIAGRYEEICQGKGIRLQGTADSTWYRFVMRVPDPEATVAHFSRQGIETINPLQDWELVHRQVGLEATDFPNAEAAAASTVSLPIWPGMVEGEIEKVEAALHRLKVAA